MPTLLNARAGLEILRTQLQTALNADATFATYGGADVVLADDEPNESERVGRPYILLDVESDVDSQAIEQADARDATTTFEVVANGFSGADVSIANPIGSDTLLSSALMNFMRANYGALRDAGLYRNRIEQGKERIEQGDAEPETHRNPHRILFTYYTP